MSMRKASLAISAPTCQTLALPTDPLLAIAAATVGIRSFAITASSSSVSSPSAMSELTSPAESAAAPSTPT